MIHQIFINIGKGELVDIDEYYTKYKQTVSYCEKNNIKHILWGSDDIDDLLNDYPEYKEFYTELRYDIQRIDFARLLILYHHGGLYFDLDITPTGDIKSVFEHEYFIARWGRCKLPYNAIIGCHKKTPLMKECIEEVIRSYNEKSKMDIYKVRTARFVFQTTGHYALHRVLKNKINYSPVVSVYNKNKKICEKSPTELFEDSSASIWYEKQ